MAERAEVTAWRPGVHGIREVLRARFVGHVYPSHTHDAWTLLLVDDGVVRYGLHRHEHGALRSVVTLLPPDVAHDGRSALPGGFRKRVLYLERDVLADTLIGRAVGAPALADPLLRLRVHQLHEALALPGEDLEAEGRLALVAERLRGHLRGGPRTGADPGEPGLAARLRELLDASVPAGLTLHEAGRRLGAQPARLVRAFSWAYGLPPHRYLTGRRVEVARRHLLAGYPPAEAATAAGFYDQPHLNRHFKRLVGVTPARYARGRS
ncbi:AraC family transcriptional regulator [Prauserella muralis]|uniref:AraC family transcriptional regulator n=1 Tax=Prauserella muralis TaxID=588067 RepID=A0A2V4AIF1_9PSEU|nr:AraC family transcriptional regulator [Prauserella muralis]PXY19411.1 AraC family transcriptional regulator [Prauserella muralis]TWE29385.1 AraC family transcriptional regulator [Prauserella muralis]